MSFQRLGLLLFVLVLPRQLFSGDPLPGTQPLVQQEDLASSMIDGIDRFLLKQIAESSRVRDQNWMGIYAPETKLPSKIEHVNKLQALREQLAKMLGVVDTRVGDGRIEFVESFRGLVQPQSATAVSNPSTAAAVRFIRWPVIDGVWGEGMLVEPANPSGAGERPLMNVIAIPDADQTPEQLAGLTDGIEPQHQWARILASSGCRVLVPALINRQVAKRGPLGEAGRAELTSREFVYRPAFEMGRHVIGYEIQQVLALVDLLSDSQSDNSASPAIAVAGYGEGGLIALASAALDTRIDVTLVSGYFGPREDAWKEPICRNVFGQLNLFSDAEMAALVFPRELMIDFRVGPTVTLRTQGGAPGNLRPHSQQTVLGELERFCKLVGRELPVVDADKVQSIRGFAIGAAGGNPRDHWIFDSAVNKDLLSPLERLIRASKDDSQIKAAEVALPEQIPVNNLRQTRLVSQLLDHTQKLLYNSAKVRKNCFAQLDTKTLGGFEKTIEPYRQTFSQELIGQFDLPLLPAAPRSRQSWDTPKWTGYEVMLDVFPDVVAYGALLLPKDMQPNEKRPVVVCQHGLEGRPTDVIQGDHNAYHDYAARLCDRGYIVFAPQNIYIFQDRFRTLQRKANPLGKTLFSIMVPQHQQIIHWLKTLPNVDADRIAFYGLSYGGKSAMRIPALVKDYCLSICSADFNEWIVKNASTTHPFSYVWTGEYEIFEFNLGNTYNYAEMATLICPRPFMVERGHFDGVGEDEWVGFEFAKVKNLYQAKLGIGDRTEIEWFVGPHTINGKGTFDFLDRHLLAK
jgi:cephalosporin-C deacetylase-like acetyl esterase